MQKQIEAGEFVEWAQVHDNLYGTSKASIHAAMAHGIPLLDIDVQGARAINALPELNALFVFIKPPSIDHLRQRLLARSTESPDVIEKRVRNSIAEIEASSEAFWDKVLVNDSLDECLAQLCAFLEAELGGAGLRASEALLIAEKAATPAPAAGAAAAATPATDPATVVVPHSVHLHAT
jgi:guanylate kinase